MSESPTIETALREVVESLGRLTAIVEKDHPALAREAWSIGTAFQNRLKAIEKLKQNLK